MYKIYIALLEKSKNCLRTSIIINKMACMKARKASGNYSNPSGKPCREWGMYLSTKEGAYQLIERGPIKGPRSRSERHS